ncbi:MAG: hypothetical protein ACR2QM_16085 [Longimicrobiales bacterium]
MTSSGLFRRNWRLKIAALALTVLLWATIRVGAVSRQDLPDVDVRIDNDDPNWVIDGEPSPPTIQLGLTGPARDLFRVAVDRPVIVVPIDEVTGSDMVILLRSEWVRNADRAGVSIEDFTPSTIRVQFEQNQGAAIPVSRRTTGTLPDSLSLVTPLRISPLFTNVRGPASRVDNLEAIFLEPFDLSQVIGSARFEVPLDTAGIGLKVTPGLVALTVDVATTVDQELGMRPVGLPEGETDFTVEPDSIAVTLHGAEAVLGDVDPEAVLLEVLVDPLARNLALGDEMFLPVTVRGLPELIRGTTEPDSVLVRRTGGA